LWLSGECRHQLCRIPLRLRAVTLLAPGAIEVRAMLHIGIERQCRPREFFDPKGISQRCGAEDRKSYGSKGRNPRRSRPPLVFLAITHRPTLKNDSPAV